MSDDDLIFNGQPKLPLRRRGEFWSTGWDIPTGWAIDDGGTCWMDNAHGQTLEQTSAESLISQAEKEDEKNVIRRTLGLPIPMPEWAATALAAGFKAPDGWTWT